MAKKEYEAKKQTGNSTKINEILEENNYLKETVQLPTSLVEQFKNGELGDTQILDLPPKVDGGLHNFTNAFTKEIIISKEQNNDDIKIEVPDDKKRTIDLIPIVSETSNDNHTADIVQAKEEAITLFNRYTYHPSENLIGKGGFSKIYKAYDSKLNRYVALKIYKKNVFSDDYSPIAEIKKVVDLDHPNICRYFDIEEIEQESSSGKSEKLQVCVMELLQNGNLEEYYKANQSQIVLKKLLEDILNGLTYLHKKGIIHRDIKPANILIKEDVEGPIAKIADFGVSEIKGTFKNNNPSKLVATIPYLAPEQIDPKKYGISETISFNLDLWYLGVTLYEVLTGDVLFKNNEQDGPEQIMASIISPDVPKKINNLPEPFKNIVSHCIVKDAKNRSQKAEDLLALLNPHNDSINLIEHDAETILPVELPNEIIENPPTIFTPEEEQKDVELTSLKHPQKNNDEVLENTNILTNTLFLNKIEPKPGKKVSKNNLKKLAITGLLVVLIPFIFLLKKISSNFKHTNAENSNIVETNTKPTDAIATLPASNQQTQKVNTSVSTSPKSSLAKKNDLKQKKLIPPAEQKIDFKGKENPIEKTETTDDLQQNSGNCNLVLTATEACSIRIRSLDYGNLDAGSPLEISVPTGKCFIEAASLRSNANVSEIINIPNKFINKTYSYTIRFNK